MRSTLDAIIDQCFAVQAPHTACYAEATVQHKLGIEIFKRHGVESQMEKKVPGRNEYLDVYTVLNDVRYGIELKYKTRRTASPAFEYTSHGAQNNGRYDFLWDIQRLEGFKAARVIDKGFAVFLTNDSSYWTQCRPGTGVAPFDLSSGRAIQGVLRPAWAGRYRDIALTGTYSANWSVVPRPDQIGVEVFRFCIIDV